MQTAANENIDLPTRFLDNNFLSKVQYDKPNSLTMYSKQTNVA
jgi:hypothetical protein